MWGLNTEFLLLILKSFFFHLYRLFVDFFKSETFPNFSTLISKIFVNTRNFENYGVIMT